MRGYQILITPEMIRAGVHELALCESSDGPASTVEGIYRAMDAARPPGYVTKQLEASRREFEEQEAKLCPSV